MSLHDACPISFFLIAGPCVIESMELQMETAGRLKEITSELGIPFIFKSSLDKANRTSGTSFRGPGLEAGLKVLRSEEHTSELQSLMRSSYAVFCLKKKNNM